MSLTMLQQIAYIPFGGKHGDMYSRGGYGKMDYQGNGPPVRAIKDVKIRPPSDYF